MQDKHSMITRFAQPGDIESVVELLLQFAEEAQVGFRSACSDDSARLTRLVTEWQQRHYVRVACRDDQVVGILIAELGQDFWDPKRKLLQERAWYVQSDSRGTRAGGLLWQAWDRDAAEYLAAGRVQGVLLSTQGPATAFDPGRRGWRMIEQTWMKET